MAVKEQEAKEEMMMVAERRKETSRRKSGNIDYLLMNYATPDRRRGEDRRAE